jgi:hypothetical protein
VTIASFAPQLGIITSKQRPRKLTILGSDGEEYAFLLKGHEDLRQDERVMQVLWLGSGFRGFKAYLVSIVIVNVTISSVCQTQTCSDILDLASFSVWLILCWRILGVRKKRISLSKDILSFHYLQTVD